MPSINLSGADLLVYKDKYLEGKNVFKPHYSKQLYKVIKVSKHRLIIAQVQTTIASTVDSENRPTITTTPLLDKEPIGRFVVKVFRQSSGKHCIASGDLNFSVCDFPELWELCEYPIPIPL